MRRLLILRGGVSCATAQPRRNGRGVGAGGREDHECCPSRRAPNPAQAGPPFEAHEGRPARLGRDSRYGLAQARD
jgi:hypothetical protein